MNGLTEKLYRTLSALPQAEVSAQGAWLVHEIWSRTPPVPPGKLSRRGAVSEGRLVARDPLTGALPVETAAFNNAFRFAEAHCPSESPGDAAADLACLAPAAFAATALAEARGMECRSLFHAVGLGAEAYVRLTGSLESGTKSRGFDARVISGALAAIVACAAIEKLPADKAAQALGLGSSALTGSAIGYLPLQLATAARDGIVMVLLMTCGFRGPPDPLACRWGVYDVFADAQDIGSLDVDSPGARPAGGLQSRLGSTAARADTLSGPLASVPVRTFLEELAS